MAILRWSDGRAEIDVLLARGQLQRVPASRELANHDLALAAQKLVSTELLLEVPDISSALSLAYDAARLAITALLANQGLRPTTDGGHIVLADAAGAQLAGSKETTDLLRKFDRMRRERNRSQYPALEQVDPTEAEVRKDMAVAQALLTKFEALLDVMPVY